MSLSFRIANHSSNVDGLMFRQVLERYYALRKENPDLLNDSDMVVSFAKNLASSNSNKMKVWQAPELDYRFYLMRPKRYSPN